MNTRCSIALLESALAGNLPAADETSLNLHLEECEACGAALERMAGGTAFIQEAASLLIEDELDTALPTSDDWSEADFTVEHLEPSDDPSVLGRLGGYDVLAIIGRGGMGVVLKGFDRELKRPVAIKVLAPHLAQSSLAKKRFAREAQAAAAVVHPHVVAIHQVQASGRLPFLVMPLVAGESLAERLTAQGTLELKETLRIGMQAAAGLAAAHEQGLVHRDVKPANILLEKGVERAVLTDFGLARAADDATLTRWGVIAGTPQYMSPEQARGEPLDGRSDLFSLGCVLYEMATGVSPFRADSMMATIRRLVDDSPRAMGSLNPELPPWFIAIVDRLLEKDPSRRFGSAKELSELLEGCLAHVQQPANVPLPAGLPKPAPRRGWGSFNIRSINIRSKSALAIIATLGICALGGVLLSAVPPDIAGQWSGEEWGQVVLKKTSDSQYTGTYSDTFGKQPGEIQVTWSRIERRFNGTWSEGKDRFGKISLRLVGDEIRGAHTTHPKSKINPATPRLADLTWARAAPPTGKVRNWPKALGLEEWSILDPKPSGKFLSDAVREFNEQQQEIGKGQPALTDDEVLASIRWAVDVDKSPELSDEVRRRIRVIIDRQVLNRGSRLEVATELSGVEPDRFQVWSIRLVLDLKNGAKYSHTIRNQFLWQLAADGRPIELPEAEAEAPEADATPLAAAIHGFNSTHRSLGGIDQTPLTEREVIAAIHWWKTRRNEVNVTNAEFAALQDIADQRRLPPGAEFEIITNFQPGDGYEYLIWSVRLNLRRTVKPVPYPRFGIMIRNQFVRARQIDGGKIAWGPAAPNGMQAGVRFEPHNELYAVGQRVTPHFFYRYTGDSNLDVSFPQLMTRNYYDAIHAVDASGKALDVEQDTEPSGPVGWFGSEFSFGSQHEIHGLPIVLGDVDRGDAETVIRAKPGQTVRVRFALPNVADQNAKPLETGEVAFSISEPPPKSKPVRR